MLKNARKLLHYKRDLLSEANRADFQTSIDRLDKAIKDRDRAAVEAAAQQLDTQWSQYLPPTSDAGWRENCEVFLVAIVIAIGVRTFFLQPFTIPTGSMQPTLNGIIGHPTTRRRPISSFQAVDFVMRGRNYINVVAKSDDIVVSMTERKMLFFFTFTDVQCSHSSYTVWAPADTCAVSLISGPGTEYSAGDIIARGTIDAGDHVFVDKVSYNLHAPHPWRGFRLQHPRHSAASRSSSASEGIEGSEFYIKRLAGPPARYLARRIPRYFTSMARRRGNSDFLRVMSATDGYARVLESLPRRRELPHRPRTTPSPFQPAHYFAMGDNSVQLIRQPLLGTRLRGQSHGPRTFRILALSPALGIC